MQKCLVDCGHFYNFADGLQKVTLQLPEHPTHLKLHNYGKKIKESRTTQAGTYQ